MFRILTRKLSLLFSSSRARSVFLRCDFSCRLLSVFAVGGSLAPRPLLARCTQLADDMDPKDKGGPRKAKTAREQGQQPQHRAMTRDATVKKGREKYLTMTLEERRKHYKCKNGYFLLDSVDTWPQYEEKNTYRLHKAAKGKKAKEPRYAVNEKINQKVSIWEGDITRIEIDCIVNAANESLLGGGGVDGAIHSAAGSMLVHECASLNGCDTGDAKLTLGYNLPAKHVLHTVGPIGEDTETLRRCYRTCLQIMEDNNLKTVAFPCISTGIYGYPNEAAAHVALKTARDWLEEHGDKVERIIFCLFLPVDVKIYGELMQVYFPLGKAPPGERNQKDADATKGKRDEAVARGMGAGEVSPKDKTKVSAEAKDKTMVRAEAKDTLSPDVTERAASASTDISDVTPKPADDVTEAMPERSEPEGSEDSGESRSNPDGAPTEKDKPSATSKVPVSPL